MKIQKTDNTQFGIKLNTGAVLEVTSLKIFQSEGIQGAREVINAINGKPADFSCYGHKGFKHQAKIIGEKIMNKYPEIKSATNEINTLLAQNPNIKKQELNSLLQPLIKKLGSEIDITV